MAVKPKVKSNLTKKARKAPSAVSGKKKIAAYTPKKKKPADWNEAIQKMQKDSKKKDELAGKLPDKKKGKVTAKKVKALANKPWGADPKRDQVIHANYMEYLKHVNRPRWGNSDLDADAKGQDGYSSLRLLPYVSKQLGIKPARIDALFDDKPGPKLIEALVKATIYNLYQWANFCSRLWIESAALEPPIRRVVNINVRDLLPLADKSPAYIDKLVKYLKDDKDAITAFRNLGLARYKVRLLITFDDTRIRPQTLYKLFDMLQITASNTSIWGFAVDLPYTAAYEHLPREVVILQPNNLRKSVEAEAYLDEAIEAGYRVILPYEVVKGKATSIKEIKQSAIYSKLCKSWKGLSPLITMTESSKMVKVAKVSKLCDILLV